MILAGKAAEPVLVASVLYASVKLLPIVHFPPQFEVAVFIAQFVALDIGGLSLNKLADQAKKDGNAEGATHAQRLSIALVSVMLIGVIMAGVDQIIKIEGQVGTVIDTILLIARAVMAVLYSRAIHSLKKDDELEPPSEEEIETALRKRADAPVRPRETRTMSSKVRSITEAPSRQRGGTQEVDKVIWQLLNTGMTVRAIALKANTSTATVGRSRQRWEAAQKNVLPETETDVDGETAEEA